MQTKVSDEMSDDHELLKLAAKAGNARWDPYSQKFRLKLTPSGMFLGAPWDPLNDDGERYRLIRSLGLCVDFTDCTVWKRLPNHDLIQEYWGGDSGDEAHAVLRVVAEIGRRL